MADVMALKAKLPPRQKASWVALLKSCHKELHGQPCYINGCPASGETFDTSMQRSIKHVWESADVSKARHAKACSTCTLKFDFLSGEVRVCHK